MSGSLLDQLFPPNQQRSPTHKFTSGFASHPELIANDSCAGWMSEQVKTRWAMICTLELQGFGRNEIAAKIGLAPETVTSITRDERYIRHRNERLAELDNDFVAMKPLAFAALRGGLNSNDENTALRASEQWFKAASFGGFSKTEAPSTAVTAEDVARQLLQINVTVNVPESSATPRREAPYERTVDVTPSPSLGDGVE